MQVPFKKTGMWCKDQAGTEALTGKLEVGSSNDYQPNLDSWDFREHRARLRIF